MIIAHFKVPQLGNPKKVALTFDDGPHEIYTVAILDALRDAKAKATFFLVGEKAAKYPEIVRRICADGHEIGNHTWSHEILTPDNIGEQLEKTSQILAQLVNRVPKLVRAPHGKISQDLALVVWKESRARFVHWSVDPQDWRENLPALDIAGRILHNLHSGDIVLCHDNREHTVEAMKIVLNRSDCSFVTSSELAKYGKPRSR